MVSASASASASKSASASVSASANVSATKSAPQAKDGDDAPMVRRMVAETLVANFPQWWHAIRQQWVNTEAEGVENVIKYLQMAGMVESADV